MSTCCAKTEKVSQPTELGVRGGTPGTSRSSSGAARGEKLTGGAPATAAPASLNSWNTGQGEGGHSASLACTHPDRTLACAMMRATARSVGSENSSV